MWDELPWALPHLPRSAQNHPANAKCSAKILLQKPKSGKERGRWANQIGHPESVARNNSSQDPLKGIHAEKEMQACSFFSSSLVERGTRTKQPNIPFSDARSCAIFGELFGSRRLASTTSSLSALQPPAPGLGETVRVGCHPCPILRNKPHPPLLFKEGLLGPPDLRGLSRVPDVSSGRRF